MSVKPHMLSRVLGAVLAMLLVGLGLAGCGGNAVSSQPQSTSTAVPSNADPELAKVYNTVVKEQMPGLPFSVLQGAKQEGTVSIYTLRLPDSTSKLLAEFKKDFPFVHVEQYSDSGPPLYQRFVTEARAGKTQADVVQTGDPVLMGSLVKSGYIAKYPITSAGQYQLGANDNGDGYWYPFGLSTRAVVLYNTKEVSAADAAKLKSYNTLWSGAYTNHQLVLPDATSDSIGQIFFYYLQKTYGNTAYQKLSALHPLLASSTAAANAVSSGAAKVAVISESIAAQTLQSGAPVRWVVPEPSVVLPWPQAVSAQAPHPDAARLFQEFTFSKAAQTIYQQTGLPSLRKDVTAEPDYASQSWFQQYSGRKNYDLKTQDFAAKTNDIIDTFKQYFLGS